jgi:hypothetical protein
MKNNQDWRIKLAVLKYQLRTGKLIKKGTKSIRPESVLTKKSFEQSPFIYKSKNQEK